VNFLQHIEILEPIIAVPYTILFLLAILGCGKLIVSDNKCKIIAFALGFLAIGTITYFACLHSIFFKIENHTLLLLLIVPAAYGALGLISSIKKDYVAYILGAIIFFTTLGSSLLLPYSWDEQVYQIALPWEYLQAKSIMPLKDNPFSAFPSLYSYVVLVAIKIAGLTGARILTSTTLAIVVASLFSLVKRHNKYNCYFIIAAFILSPLVTFLGRSLYAEVYLGLLTVAAIAAIRNLRQYPHDRVICLAAIAGGLFAMKYTAAGLSLGLFLYVLVTKFKLRYLFSFIAISIIFVLPFLYRSFEVFDNPFYPFTFGILPDTFNANIVGAYHQLLGSYRYGVSSLMGIVFGWLFPAFEAKIYDGVLVGFQLPIMFLIAWGSVALIRIKHPSKMRLTALGPVLLFFAAYIYWAITSQQTRFMFPIFILVTYYASWALAKFSLKIKVVLLTILTIGTIYSINNNYLRHYYLAWKLQKNVMSNPIGCLITATKDKGYFGAIQQLQIMKKNLTVLLLGERRTLYIPQKSFIGESYFQGQFLTPLPNSLEAFKSEICKGCFDIILYSDSRFDVDKLEQYQDVRDTVADYLNKLIQSGNLEVIYNQAGTMLLKINSE
jgi:hypothetical protein